MYVLKAKLSTRYACLATAKKIHEAGNECIANSKSYLVN